MAYLDISLRKANFDQGKNGEKIGASAASNKRKRGQTSE
jgi:hypothetical protein